MNTRTMSLVLRSISGVSLALSLVIILSFNDLIPHSVLVPFDFVLIPSILIASPLLLIAFISQLMRQNRISRRNLSVDFVATALPVSILVWFAFWMGDHR